MHVLLRHSRLMIALHLGPENLAQAKQEFWFALEPVHPLDQQETVELI